MVSAGAFGREYSFVGSRGCGREGSMHRLLCKDESWVFLMKVIVILSDRAIGLDLIRGPQKAIPRFIFHVIGDNFLTA